MTIRRSNEQILGIVAMDFEPLGDEAYIEYNLFARSSSSNAQFDYFLLDPVYLNESYDRTEDFLFGEATWNTQRITELITELLYTNDSGVDTIKKRSIVNLQDETIYYAEFTGGGQQRYMFFSPWYLNMRARDDRYRRVVGDIFVLISTKDFFDTKRADIIRKVENYALFVGLATIAFMITFGFMLSNWIANKYSGVIVKQICDASKSILEFNYSLLKQRLGSQDKIKNIINKREVKEEIKITKNELDLMMNIFGEFVRMFRIYFIDLTQIDDKQLLNQILIEYYSAKKRAEYNNKWYPGPFTFIVSTLEHV